MIRLPCCAHPQWVLGVVGSLVSLASCVCVWVWVWVCGCVGVCVCVCVQASGPAMLPGAAFHFKVTVHPPRCVPITAHYLRCVKAPVGVGHALCCLTIQLTRILTLGT